MRVGHGKHCVLSVSHYYVENTKHIYLIWQLSFHSKERKKVIKNFHFSKIDLKFSKSKIWNNVTLLCQFSQVILPDMQLILLSITKEYAHRYNYKQKIRKFCVKFLKIESCKHNISGVEVLVSSKSWHWFFFNNFFWRIKWNHMELLLY